MVEENAASWPQVVAKECSICGVPKPESDFYRRKNGRLRSDCKSCVSERSGRWQRANRERKRSISNEYYCRNRERELAKARKRSQELKKEAMMAYGGECACCGERRLPFLSLDHVNKDGAQHRRTTGVGVGPAFYRGLKRAAWPQEPPLRVLCFNCNTASYWGVCPHQEETNEDY